MKYVTYRVLDNLMDYFDKYGFQDGCYEDLNAEAFKWVRKFVRLLNKEFELAGLVRYRAIFQEWTSHNYCRVNILLDNQLLDNQVDPWSREVKNCVEKVAKILRDRDLKFDKIMYERRW